MTEHLTVGIIRGPHGLEGKFKVESTSGETEHFAQFREVTLRKDSAEKTFAVESVEGCAANLLMKCAGIGAAEEAKKYCGWKITVPGDMACPLNTGQYYVEDLKQCKLLYYGLAADAAPAEVGMITGVLEGGAGDLLEVTLSESFNLSTYINFKTDELQNRAKTRYIPFRSEFIGKVDIPRKEIELMHLWILE